MSTCDSCSAPIEWGRTEKGKPIPMDPDTGQENANLAIDGRGVDGTPMVRVVAPGDGDRVSHFATCPNAAKHRKRRTT